MTFSQEIDTIPHIRMWYFGCIKIAIKGVIAGLVVVSLVLNPIVVRARDVTDRFRDELWYLDQMSLPEAWNRETGDEQTVVAVLDAGFDLDHEDLLGIFLRNEDEFGNDQIDDDHNGYEDDIMGWDFVDDDPDVRPEIADGVSDLVASHGTAISGIIGATANNGLGISGINWDVSIMPLRVLDEFGSGTTKNIRRAIEYAVENGADVINLSFTFSQTDAKLRETITWAYEQGVVVVAAVGNGAVNTDKTPIYPACFDTETGVNAVIGVAATDKGDKRASFSNYGTRCTDIAAPGTDIYVAVYEYAGDLAYTTSYASFWEGTSMAAPMVSGVVALLLSSYPSLTPDQVRNALKLSVDPVDEPTLEARKQLGSGRINAVRALEYAKVFAGVGTAVTKNDTEASGSFVVSQGQGSEPIVRRMNGKGEILAEFLAYGKDYLGGVRLTVGDVDGDGKEEIVTGTGFGGGPQVRIFDLSGNVEGQFFAFEEGDRQGIHIASGDVNADGVDEILVASDVGGTGQVRIFNKYGHLKGEFFPFGRTDKGISISVANLDSDPALEIISTEAQKGEGEVFIHDGTGRYQSSFTIATWTNSSINTTGADIDGDGIEEVLVANASSGHTPEVRAYSPSGSLKQTVFAFPLTYTQGIQIASGDIDNNGIQEVYVTPTKGGPQVRIFDSQAKLIGGFFAFDSLNRYGADISIY